MERAASNLDTGQLVFIDKVSINLVMTRLYGWGDRHVRVEDYVSDVRFERMFIISVVCLLGVGASVVFRGALNGEFFGLYVKCVFVSILSVGMWCCLMICRLIRLRVCWVLFLSVVGFVWFLFVCSLVLNFVELLWLKVKVVLRKFKVRIHEELQIVLKSALAVITFNGIKDWFKHDGYASILFQVAIITKIAILIIF
jgi:hypothetical protein